MEVVGIIKPGYEARAYQEINRLIDEGEGILETCSLDQFSTDGGPESRRNTIEQWLAKAENQVSALLVDAEDARLLCPALLSEQIEALSPQPPSHAQLRNAFVGFIQERLQLLNTMIGR